MRTAVTLDVGDLAEQSPAGDILRDAMRENLIKWLQKADYPGLRAVRYAIHQHEINLRAPQ